MESFLDFLVYSRGHLHRGGLERKGMPIWLTVQCLFALSDRQDRPPGLNFWSEIENFKRAPACFPLSRSAWYSTVDAHCPETPTCAMSLQMLLWERPAWLVAFFWGGGGQRCGFLAPVSRVRKYFSEAEISRKSSEIPQKERILPIFRLWNLKIQSPRKPLTTLTSNKKRGLGRFFPKRH